MQTIDYYKILQVDPDADPEVIEATYRRLSLKYHPDKNPSPDATRRMKDINNAHDILGDPVKRAVFNRERAEAYARERTEAQYARDKAEAQYASGRTEAPPPQATANQESWKDILIGIGTAAVLGAALAFLDSQRKK